ncbi:hypothetical protein FGO68_gene374 [Halteria grandinella]|uniref:Uncharacterized protein n=1 Tax=Halteria grandinella TaxID=5974 RepID=A0A8J8P3W8_HALGN|nr:hypothetical protein FGO68_gene374 [Halteria grandinella]
MCLLRSSIIVNTLFSDFRNCSKYFLNLRQESQRKREQKDYGLGMIGLQSCQLTIYLQLSKCLYASLYKWSEFAIIATRYSHILQSVLKFYFLYPPRSIIYRSRYARRQLLIRR